MKKTFATIALGLVVLFGSNLVQAGIIVGDNKDTSCTVDMLGTFMGIIVGDYSGTGTVQCTQRDGIIVGD